MQSSELRKSNSPVLVKLEEAPVKRPELCVEPLYDLLPARKVGAAVLAFIDSSHINRLPSSCLRKMSV